MTHVQKVVTVSTPGRGFTDISDTIRAAIHESGVRTGLCNVFVRHTSASLLIQENADPAVLRDLERWLSSLAPESRAWEHVDEGPDDMPAHARCAVTRTSEIIPIVDAKAALGTWQAVYLWEHRSSPHQRQIVVHIWGD
jgi:secondary thiamine-phosphate synthase enzyme